MKQVPGLPMEGAFQQLNRGRDGANAHLRRVRFALEFRWRETHFQSLGPSGARALRTAGSRPQTARSAVGLVLLIAAVPAAWSHGVAGADQGFIEGNVGLAVAPYAYLGAKHMVTGYDHLLFLAGVIFFLRRLRDVAAYVTLFAAGHSLTLLIGVLGGVQANPHLIDAVIGLSVAYKAFENLGGFKAMRLAPNAALAVFAFGLFHGFGLATKLQETRIAPEGLVGNIIAFNVGVELGQLAALGLLLGLLSLWRTNARFPAQAAAANWGIMTAGFTFMLHQLASYRLA